MCVSMFNASPASAMTVNVWLWAPAADHEKRGVPEQHKRGHILEHISLEGKIIKHISLENFF